MRKLTEDIDLIIAPDKSSQINIFLTSLQNYVVSTVYSLNSLLMSTSKINISQFSQAALEKKKLFNGQMGSDDYISS